MPRRASKLLFYARQEKRCDMKPSTQQPCPCGARLPQWSALHRTVASCLSRLPHTVREHGRGRDADRGERSTWHLQHPGEPWRNRTPVLKELRAFPASPQARSGPNTVHLVLRAAPRAKTADPVARDLGGGGWGHRGEEGRSA